MYEDFYVIDGCAFCESDFTGVTKEVRESPLTAFFLTSPGENENLHSCVSKIGGVYNLADDPASGLKVVRTIADLEAAKAEGKIGIILAFQDPRCIEDSLDQLRALYELGIRVVQMTYNKANYIGCGCLESHDSGLTDFGRKALKAMNRYGVIGVSPWGPLCWKKETGKRPEMSDYLDHVDYIANLIGIDHIGFGGDSTLDDNEDKSGIVEQATLYAPVVEDYNRCVGVDPAVRHAVGVRGSWEIGNVIEAMRKRGYSDQDIGKFTGGNFIRVLKANWK